MSKSRIFIGIAVSFAAGIWLASRFVLPRQIIFIALALCAVAFALSFNLKNKILPLMAVFLFCASLGALRLQASMYQSEYQELFDSKQEMEGYIVEDVDIRQTFQFLTILPKGFSQRILVSVPVTSNYFYGDWVVLNGKVQEPQAFDDFDYPKYLERHNVYAVMKYPKILPLKSHKQNLVKEWLLQIKWSFTKRVDKFLQEPQSSLLMGILIGARKTLPQEVIDNFNATGVSHVIAISGYNISIIVSWLGFLAHWPGRRARLYITLAVILGFVVLSGASASVIRAAVMGVLLLLAGNIGRQYSVGPSLFFAAFIMLLLNPKILFWDAGFQLSFLATMGIVYFMPLLEQLTPKWDNFLNIKSTLLTTISAIAATLPLILFTFGRLSIVAPLVNILILPLVPLTMLLGFFSVLPWIGRGFAFAAGLALRYMLSVTENFSHVPYGNVSIKISQYQFAFLGIIIVGAYFWLRHISLGRKKAVDEK